MPPCPVLRPSGAPDECNPAEAAGIRDDSEGPLFRPFGRDRKTLLRKPMARQDIWEVVKRYARKVGIDADRVDGRGVGVHSLRKTALTNAAQNGAPLTKVKQLAGHADIRTTALYYQPTEKDSEEAARHIHIW